MLGIITSLSNMKLHLDILHRALKHIIVIFDLLFFLRQLLYKCLDTLIGISFCTILYDVNKVIINLITHSGG